MHSYFAITTDNSDSVSDKYICVNNVGYNEDVDKMDVRREFGRKDYQLIYIKQGKLVVFEAEKKHIVTAGHVCLFSPCEPQIYSVDSEITTFYWVHFSGTETKQMLSFFKRRSYYVGAFPEFERYCRECIVKTRHNHRCFELFCEGGLITLISHIAERLCHYDKKNDKLTKITPAIEIMKSQYWLKRSNDELAKLCKISRYYFIKLFKNVTGVTPSKYYQMLSIEKSIYFLINTSYNISEIALLCGIEDSLYFSRIFKKHTGLSPSDYRKKMIEPDK